MENKYYLFIPFRKIITFNNRYTNITNIGITL